MMDEKLFEQLVTKHLEDFREESPDKVECILKAKKKWDLLDDKPALLDWWKTQSFEWIDALQSFMFSLWTSNKIEYNIFETVYNTLTPVQTKSWSMPIIFTTGEDEPILKGGLFGKAFSLFQYTFSPISRGLQVTREVVPEHEEPKPDLDILLDILSFILVKLGVRPPLGLRKITSQKSSSSSTSAVGISLGPEIQDLPNFNLEIIEQILPRVLTPIKNTGFSLLELLHIRHRAILDSNPESKLITLWAFLEAKWGKEDAQDQLLSPEERVDVKKALAFLPDERKSKVLNQLSLLKSKTKNEKIMDEITKLKYAEGRDIKNTVSEIHALRSKFAHGGRMSDDEREKTNRHISFMMGIVDELIIEKFKDHNIQVK